MSATHKRSITIAGHRTSISLEPSFWDALNDIARAQGKSVNEIVRKIDAARGNAPADKLSLSAAIRVYLIEHFRSESSDDPAPN